MYMYMYLSLSLSIYIYIYIHTVFVRSYIMLLRELRALGGRVGGSVPGTLRQGDNIENSINRYYYHVLLAVVLLLLLLL